MHSISPCFQQAAFDALGINARYEAWDVLPQDLPAAINGLRADAVLGANVTIPHKGSAARFVDRLHQTARFVGAINTVVNVNGELEGYNSDVGGFQAALEGAGYRSPGCAYLYLGRGWGRARPSHGLSFGAVRAHSRSLIALPPVPAACDTISLPTPAPSAFAPMGATRSERVEELRTCDIVVHCTPVGLKGSDTASEIPFDTGALRSEAVVVDLVANPMETPLVRRARATGHKSLGGLPMLVHQGAASFELWTRRAAPLAAMFAAAEAAMRDPLSPEQTEQTP